MSSGMFRCDQGENCRWQHDVNSRTPRKKNELCRYFGRRRGCNLGEHCPFQHQTESGEERAEPMPKRSNVVQKTNPKVCTSVLTNQDVIEMMREAKKEPEETEVCHGCEESCPSPFYWKPWRCRKRLCNKEPKRTTRFHAPCQGDKACWEKHLGKCSICSEVNLEYDVQEKISDDEWEAKGSQKGSNMKGKGSQTESNRDSCQDSKLEHPKHDLLRTWAKRTSNERSDGLLKQNLAEALCQPVAEINSEKMGPIVAHLVQKKTIPELQEMLQSARKDKTSDLYQTFRREVMELSKNV